MIELKSIILVYSNGMTRRVAVEPVQAIVSPTKSRSPRRVRCKICGDQFSPMGMGGHLKFCEARAARIATEIGTK